MTVLGIDYSDYVFFFVCNNPTEDDQCESMQAHGLTRERVIIIMLIITILLVTTTTTTNTHLKS